MELSVRVLCRPEIAPGFELAGLEVDRADETTAAETLRRLASDAKVGVVLIEERLRRALSDEIVQRLDRQASPVLVPFPSPAWEGRGVAEEYALEILRQAIGYRVRPR